MKNIRQLFLLVSILVLIFALYNIYQAKNTQQRIKVTTTCCVTVPPSVKHIGIIGSTPHPTEYLRAHKFDSTSLEQSNLEDILDIHDLRDSYIQLFTLCKAQALDHVVIAYLPIYFVGLVQHYGKNLTNIAQLFFTCVMPKLIESITDAAQYAGYHGTLELCIPPAKSFNTLPEHVDIEDRIRYLVKHLPKITFNTNLETITIINNNGSQEQSNKIIDYMRFEYLLEKPILYKTLFLKKNNFHHYINHKE